MFLPGQCVFLLAAFAAAALSRQPQRQRLGFVRSRMSGWAIPLFILATPFAGLVGGWLATSVFGESSKHLKLMGDVVSGQRGPMAAAVVFLMVVLAPFAEETLFRGYVLRRLLERWRPAAAIGVSALIFTSAHLDPYHMLGVLPIGIWFGAIAWRTGAVWPGMLCHAAQNLLATIGMFSSKHSNQPTDYSSPTVLAMFGFFFLAFAAAAAVLARKQPPARIQNAPETGGPSPQSATHSKPTVHQ
jgi:membrane protease YdiL (CAAX protease family)